MITKISIVTIIPTPMRIYVVYLNPSSGNGEVG